MVSVSTILRDIFDRARPLVEQSLDLTEAFAALREEATAKGLDWSQIKALLKAQMQDERGDNDGKRVNRIVEKAEFASAYADMLGLAKMNEKNYSEPPALPQSAGPETARVEADNPPAGGRLTSSNSDPAEGPTFSPAGEGEADVNPDRTNAANHVASKASPDSLRSASRGIARREPGTDADGPVASVPTILSVGSNGESADDVAANSVSDNATMTDRPGGGALAQAGIAARSSHISGLSIPRRPQAVAAE